MKIHDINSEAARKLHNETVLFNLTHKETINNHFRKLPETLTPISKQFWTTAYKDTLEVWESRNYQVQVVDEKHGVIRVTVHTTSISEDGHWKDGLTWDDLMDVKRQIGRGECHAVEVLPSDRHIVATSPARHFWIIPTPIVGWFTKEGLSQDAIEEEKI